MTLNLDNHLLQAEDGLITAFLWQFALEVFAGLCAVVASSLLALLIKVGAFNWGMLDSGGCSILDLGSKSVVASGLRGLGSSVGRLCDILLLERCILVVCCLDLISKVVFGEIGCFMPSVFFSRVVNLRKITLGRVDLSSRLLGSISSNVAEQDYDIVNCGSISTLK